MKTLLKIFITAAVVFVISNILPGVNVIDYNTSITVAIVLSLLQIFVKPILVLLTLPATILSMGLFLFAINSSLILMTDHFVSGFTVSGFWTALLFSLFFTFTQSSLYKLVDKENTNKKDYYFK